MNFYFILAALGWPYLSIFTVDRRPPLQVVACALVLLRRSHANLDLRLEPNFGVSPLLRRG